MDLGEIMTILHNHSALDADLLLHESEVTENKVSELWKVNEIKKETVKTISDEQKDLEKELEELQAYSQDLDVALIRAKTQKKKLERNISKMTNLNSSSMKIEVSENDKRKLAMNRNKLELTKRLTRIFVNAEDKGFVINPSELEIKSFKVKKNHSKSSTRDLLWKNLEQSSPHNQTWEELSSSTL